MRTFAPPPGDDMGFFDRFRKAKASIIGDPNELRDRLIVAASAGNRKPLTALARANRELIATHFPAWRQLPEAIRDDPTRAQRYIHGLIAIAEVFDQDLGDPTLVQFLTGPDEENPLARWRQGLQHADAQVEALEYRAAATTLNDLLIEARSLRGSGADRYLPVTYGQLGDCYFHSGGAEKAISPFLHALELCERSGDTEGVIAYLRSLHEVHRYLGRTDEAADFAERLADALKGMARIDASDSYRRRAAQVRAGEPLNRVVIEVAGRRYEVAEAPPVAEGKVQFFHERNRISLRPATILVDRGSALAITGDHEAALELFRDAARADRFDPQPRYLEGLTLLLLERHHQAVEAYEATEELAGGWYHCRSNLWLARRLALGEWEHEAFLALFALVDGPGTPKEKHHLARRAVAQWSGLAPLYLELGQFAGALGHRQEAEAAYREGLTYADEPDIRSRLLVQLGVITRSEAERSCLLREAMELEGNLVSAAMATVFRKR
ncbi:tetratricopeptide repeat protein [Singulisphaera sp. Ch08]|uniref:Tetratricopeptide repeat protein n=1 Tax=Singulisphaera sp. Ch08 TaxID=3120278 RepID=A0AAU7CHL8_9BACT